MLIRIGSLVQLELNVDKWAADHVAEIGGWYSLIQPGMIGTIDGWFDWCGERWFKVNVDQGAHFAIDARYIKLFEFLHG